MESVPASTRGAGEIITFNGFGSEGHQIDLQHSHLRFQLLHWSIVLEYYPSNFER